MTESGVQQLDVFPCDSHQNTRQRCPAAEIIDFLTMSGEENQHQELLSDSEPDVPHQDVNSPNDRPTRRNARRYPMVEVMDIMTRSVDEDNLTLSDEDPDYDQVKNRAAEESSDDDAEQGNHNDTEVAPGTNQENGGQNDDQPSARNHARTNKPLIRKSQRDPSTWKSVVRKTLRQSGKQYTDSRGKVQKAREIKYTKDCDKCRFKCSQHISQGDRQAIFQDFWSLDGNEKCHFYATTTTCEDAKRKRIQAENSQRKRMFTYFLKCDGKNVHVCKDFYLNTIAISQKRVNNFHDSKQRSGTPTRLAWGKSVTYAVSQDVKDGIRAHIKSIPRVQSHYSGADTNKEYVSQYGLNVAVCTGSM